MDQRRRTGVHLLATGVNLPFVEQGDPAGTPPVLLLHPWGEAMGCFDRLLSHLTVSIHALAMDQRGHGAASKPAHGYALADFAEDVVSFLDAAELDSAVLVGSSSGGYVAQQVALIWPDRVSGLVLLGSPLTLRGTPAFADEVNRLTDPIDRDWVARSLTWFPRVHDVPAWYVDARIDDGLAMPAHVWRDALKGLTDAAPPTQMGTIVAPTLIVWGDCDAILPREDEESLLAAIPASRLVVYERTGHLLLWEQPERVARDVAEFVATLAPASRR